MHELINRLVEKAGVTADQAHKSLETMKDFVKEKFPMMAGAVDNLFGSEAAPISGAANDSGTSKVADFAKSATNKAEDVFDDLKEKMHEALNSDTAQKVEGYAKTAADKAEDVFDDVKEKLKEATHGETGQKVEDFAKSAANKAEGMFEEVKEKLGDFFKDDKKA